MDLHRLIGAAMKEHRANEVDESGQIGLGELVNAVSAIPPDELVTVDGVITPTHVISYRGYYDELAIDYTHNSDGIKASELRDMLESAIGSVFTGYKGGDFRMHRNTPVWVSNYGTCDNMAVVGVAHVDGSWRIVTRVPE